MSFNHARGAVLLSAVAFVLILAGCGVWNNPALLVDGSVTITEVTGDSISITWTPAENEPSVGSGYDYQVYTSGTAMNSAFDLESADLRTSGTVDVFGEEEAAANITDLTAGTGYYVNVAAVNQRSGEAVLYDGAVAITIGATAVSDDFTTSPDPWFHHPVATDGSSTAIAYSIELGSTARDVYIVFSNPEDADAARPEVVLGSIAGTESVAWPSTSQAPLPARSVSPEGPSGPVILRDRPEVHDWDAPALSYDAGSASRAVTPPPPGYDFEGQTGSFEDEEGVLIDATARKVVTEGASTLNIWVEDSEWDNTVPIENGKVSQEMVDALADSFLSGVDGDDDIYEWLTAIYGDQWGPHGYGNLIDDTNEITILLWNIGNDGAGGIVGYFWAKDNFKASAIPYSNERVMFYLDSESLGTRSGISWEKTDFWPQEMVATLAHEFQHMIHYYQRDILLGADTPVWLNEMMSQVSEDLVSRNLLGTQALDIAGPRGVAPSTDLESGSAGNAGNQLGRLPLYNAFPSISLTRWLSGSSVLRSYSIAYAFGAFLSRTYGGAPLMEAMMDSAESETAAILIDAIELSGGPLGTTMDELLWQWGVSVLLSDDESASPEVQMNTGIWFDTTVGTTFSLGSVNHFNYFQDGTSDAGAAVHPVPGYTLPELEAVSVATYQLADGESGTIDAGLLIPAGASYTVVVK